MRQIAPLNNLNHLKQDISRKGMPEKGADQLLK